jgi:hypothetical protein
LPRGQVEIVSRTKYDLSFQCCFGVGVDGGDDSRNVEGKIFAVSSKQQAQQ